MISFLQTTLLFLLTLATAGGVLMLLTLVFGTVVGPIAPPKDRK